MPRSPPPTKPSGWRVAGGLDRGLLAEVGRGNGVVTPQMEAFIVNRGQLAAGPASCRRRSPRLRAWHSKDLVAALASARALRVVLPVDRTRGRDHRASLSQPRPLTGAVMTQYDRSKGHAKFEEVYGGELRRAATGRDFTVHRLHAGDPLRRAVAGPDALDPRRVACWSSACWRRRARRARWRSSCAAPSSAANSRRGSCRRWRRSLRSTSAIHAAHGSSRSATTSAARRCAA